MQARRRQWAIEAGKFLASKVALYARELGPVAGLKTFAAVYLAGKVARDANTRQWVTVEIPSVRSPIKLRRDTTDVGTFEHLFFTDQYAPRHYPRLEPRFIVDCGANIGLSALYFANRYALATIVAIEPEASNFALLCENVASYPNVKPLHAAIWSRSQALSSGRWESG